MLCLIPAKGCSTRLPRKNLLPLGGESLLAHTIKKAKEIPLFKTICVSTEDDEIASLSKALGVDVPFMRPEHLARDPSTIVDVILHALEQYERIGIRFRFICVLLPTAPFVTESDIREAISAFGESQAAALLSVTETEFPPYNAWVINHEETRLKPCFPNSPFRATKSTECPKTYRSNGAILIVDTAKLKEKRSYQGEEIIHFVMPQIRSLDIDTELEYQFAKFLYETNI